MSRYIDADKFYVCQTARCKGEPLIGTCTNNNVKLYDEIQKFPAANATEIVRCKNCIYFQDRYIELPGGAKRAYKKGEDVVTCSVGINVGSYCTRIDYAIVHGYRNGEPSVDNTRLWVSPNDFCSYGERKV